MSDLFGQKLFEKPDIDGEQYAGIIRRETKAAILFDDGERQVWLPKSQIAIELTGQPASTGMAAIVTVPDWLAKEKAMIDLPAHRSNQS